MRIGFFQRVSIAIAVGLSAVVWLAAQEPAPGRGGGAGQGQGRGGAAPVSSPRYGKLGRSPLSIRRRTTAAARCGPATVSTAWLPGAGIGHRSEHHPDENREFRPDRRRRGKCTRPFLKAGQPDAEPETERVLHRPRDRGAGALPGSGSTTPCGARHCSPSGHRDWRAQGRGRGTSTAPADAPPVTTPPPAILPALRQESRAGRHAARMLFPGGGGPAAAAVDGRRRSRAGARERCARGAACRSTGPRRSERGHCDDRHAVRPAVRGPRGRERRFYVTLRQPDGHGSGRPSHAGNTGDEVQSSAGHIDLLDRSATRRSTIWSLTWRR